MKRDTLAQGELTDPILGFRRSMQRNGVTVPYRFDRYTRNDALGDARNSSLEYGTALMESVLKNFVGFMAEAVAQSPGDE